MTYKYAPGYLIPQAGPKIPYTSHLITFKAAGDIYQLDTKTLIVRRNRQVLHLSEIQLRLFNCMTRNVGDLVDRDELIAVAWPDVIVHDRTLDVHIKRMRDEFHVPIDTRTGTSDRQGGYGILGKYTDWKNGG